MPEVKDKTPLEEALVDHLEKMGWKDTAPALVKPLSEAVAVARLATEGEDHLLDRSIELPGGGGPVPVFKIIQFFHLNAFIMKGGEEV